MNIVTPDWPAPANIKACTTTKNIWGEPDAPPTSSVTRQKLEAALSLPASPIWLQQTHGINAVPATKMNIDTDADASFAVNTHTVCVVLTADCLPILLCNKHGTKVAAIHAGWRGLAGGVIESTLAALGEDGDNLLAWLGPAIGPEKFEVGNDVYSAFVNEHPQATIAFKPHGPDKWLANLYALANIRLQNAGVQSIYGGNFCTHTQSDLFYSYRRDNKHTGRMATLIWIQE